MSALTDNPASLDQIIEMLRDFRLNDPEQRASLIATVNAIACRRQSCHEPVAVPDQAQSVPLPRVTMGAMEDQEKIDRLVSAFNAVLRQRDAHEFADELCDSLAKHPDWTPEGIEQLRRRLLQTPGTSRPGKRS
jgi:hypothetical protein